MTVTPSPQRPSHLDVSWLLDNKKFSDLTIECRDQKWSVHKAILAGGSGYFKAAGDSQMKESKEGAIDLSGDAPGYIYAMLQFFYTGRYERPDVSASEIAFDTRMYNIADYYNAPTLAEYVKTALVSRAEDDWKGSGLAEAVNGVFTATQGTEALHEELVNIAFKHTNDLYAKDYGARFREIVRSVPLYGALLTEKLAAQRIADTKSRLRVLSSCQQCEKSFFDDKLYKEDGRIGFRCPDCHIVSEGNACDSEVDFDIFT